MRMDKDIEKILFTNEDIKAAVQKLGQKLTEDYQDKNPVVVGILRGAAPFMIDLIRAMDCYMKLILWQFPVTATTRNLLVR